MQFEVIRMMLDSVDAFLWIAVLIAVLCALFVMLEVWMAWREVEHTDKGKYFVCEKHGPLPATALIAMEQPDGEPVQTCPICYEEAFRVADQRLRSIEEKRAGHPAGN